MKHFIENEFSVNASQHAFECWLGRVECLLIDPVDSTGVDLLMSDEAHDAFENGVNASDYALQLQAGKT